MAKLKSVPMEHPKVKHMDEMGDPLNQLHGLLKGNDLSESHRTGTRPRRLIPTFDRLLELTKAGDADRAKKIKRHYTKAKVKALLEKAEINTERIPWTELRSR